MGALSMSKLDIAPTTSAKYDAEHETMNSDSPRPHPGGQDPTRTGPGGSLTETKITQSSELGEDGVRPDAAEQRSPATSDRPGQNKS